MAFKIDYGPAMQSSRTGSMALAGGLSALGSGIAKDREERKASAKAEALQGLAGRAMAGDEEAQDELAYTDPKISSAIMERVGAKTEAQQKAMIYDMAEVKNLHSSGQPEAALDYLDQRAAAIDARGGDSQHTRAIRDMYEDDPEKGSQYINMSLMHMINPQEFAKMSAPGMEGETKVGAQEILEDGTIIQSTSKGPVVFNPLGEKVTGQAAADAILVGRAEKVSNLREAAGQKRAATLEEDFRLKGQVEANVVSAKNAAKISTDAYSKLEKINTSIANMNEGIQILTEDPNMTGPVMKMLPSVRKNAIKLANLQGRMGLDVIGNTTFGALSESELKFALSTALPTGLQGPELKEWMIQKRNSQEKLADYIEASAIFLGTPGNTVKDWVVLQKEKRTKRIESGEASEAERARAERAGAGGPRQAPNIAELSNEDLMKAAFGGK